ncbi:MAG: LysR family transcriptional regulator, partial [Nevskia sp.]|nr:LysR family transcriptional regulator [Nevskia sp.]
MNVETPFLDVPAFLRVVELKSFTRAADALGTSQSAVSQAVSRLEKRLGVLLLRRTTRSLSLTAEGERFFARSRDLLLELQDAEAVELARVQHILQQLGRRHPAVVAPVVAACSRGKHSRELQLE